MDATSLARTGGTGGTDHAEPLSWCTRLEGVLSELDALLSEVDPGVCGVEQALGLLGAFARVRRAGAAGEVLVAARVEACRGHERTGHRSAAHLLADVGGTTMGRATEVVETGRRLDACAETSVAMREGRVSAEQAREVTKAAVVAPDKERELLAFAAGSSLGRLKTRAREERLAVEDDRWGRYERQRRHRRLWYGIDDEGMGWGSWSLPPDAHAAVVNRLERQADREYRHAHRSGRAEAHDRHLADALVTLCTRRRGGNDVASRDLRSEVVVHVSLTELLGHQPRHEDLCLVQGGGPIPVERVRAVLADNAFVKGLLHHGTDILKVRHFGRSLSAELRTALDAREVRRHGDVVTDEDGFERHHGHHWDHRQPRSHGGETSYENLDLRSRPGHRDKTEHERRQQPRAGPDPP